MNNFSSFKRFKNKEKSKSSREENSPNYVKILFAVTLRDFASSQALACLCYLLGTNQIPRSI